MSKHKEKQALAYFVLTHPILTMISSICNYKAYLQISKYIYSFQSNTSRSKHNNVYKKLACQCWISTVFIDSDLILTGNWHFTYAQLYENYKIHGIETSLQVP